MTKASGFVVAMPVLVRMEGSGRVQELLSRQRPRNDDAHQPFSFGELYFIDTAKAVLHQIQNVPDQPADVLLDLLEY